MSTSAACRALAAAMAAAIPTFPNKTVVQLPRLAGRESGGNLRFSQVLVPLLLGELRAVAGPAQSAFG
jgi:hypothetical protein